MSQEKHVVFGSDNSPYSIKARAYFAFKGVPFEWVVRSQSNEAEYRKVARLAIVPAVRLPGGKGESVVCPFATSPQLGNGLLCPALRDSTRLDRHAGLDPDHGVPGQDLSVSSRVQCAPPNSAVSCHSVAHSRRRERKRLTPHSTLPQSSFRLHPPRRVWRRVGQQVDVPPPMGAACRPGKESSEALDGSVVSCI